MWRGACFPTFSWHFPLWVQLSKKLQNPPGCQGNISPWWDVRQDGGIALILESYQATQWAGDITGAMAASQRDTAERVSQRWDGHCHIPPAGGWASSVGAGGASPPAVLWFPLPLYGWGHGCDSFPPQKGTVGQSCSLGSLVSANTPVLSMFWSRLRL